MAQDGERVWFVLNPVEGEPEHEPTPEPVVSSTYSLHGAELPFAVETPWVADPQRPAAPLVQPDQQPLVQPEQQLFDDLPDQRVRYMAIRETLNAGHAFGVEGWIIRFGRMTQEAPWGDNVWAGMLALYRSNYRHQWRMGSVLFFAWFLKPFEFSQRNSRLPPGPSDTEWYPAIFTDDEWQGLFGMTCLHIVIVGCRPWWVHPARISSPIVRLN